MDTDELLARAESEGTTQLAVWRDGELVLDWVAGGAGSDEPIELMSCTKLVVAIAFGAVLGDDAVAALDRPVATWLPQWRDDDREAITIRMLLAHTSGLTAPASSVVYEQPDVVTGALALERDPGLVGRFAYNNAAINIVGGVVRAITDLPLHQAATGALFEPLGWSSWEWQTDEAGNCYCFAGLRARAADAAAVCALLVRDPEGRLPADWSRELINGGLSCYSQPAWILASLTEAVLDEWRDGGLDRAALEVLRPLVGPKRDLGAHMAIVTEAWTTAGLDPYALWPAIVGRGMRRGDVEIGPRVAVGHDGDGGQRLVAFPGALAAACRLRRMGDEDTGSDWTSFPGDVAAVIGLD